MKKLLKTMLVLAGASLGLGLAQLVIAVPFAVFSSRVSAENLVGMDANTAFFGFALVLYGVFNLVFFRNYYRAPGKVGKAFGWGCGALTLCMVVFEACAHTVPFVRDRLDTPDPAFLGEKLTLLAAGAALYVLLSALALRRAMHSFAALDL